MAVDRIQLPEVVNKSIILDEEDLENAETSRLEGDLAKKKDHLKLLTKDLDNLKKDIKTLKYMVGLINNRL